MVNNSIKNLVLVATLSCSSALVAQEVGLSKKDREKSAQDILSVFRKKMTIEFDSFLKKPEAYRDLVQEECRGFPEGDLFPYIFPALAYANLAKSDQTGKAHALKQMAKLIPLARSSVIRRVNPPSGNLQKLKDYKKQAVYLGQYNMLLGAWRLIGGDDRYQPEHKAVSDALHAALTKQGGCPLESFPNLTWPFDTIPCLVSLQLYDRHTGIPRSREAIKNHLIWVNEKALDPVTGLPGSLINIKTGEQQEKPRGCDLSLRLCLLPHIDKKEAARVYKKYTKAFWLEKGMIAGFAEWPYGKTEYQDMDSGPIFLDIGLAATGLGLGASIAANDTGRIIRMSEELANLNTLKLLARQLGADPANMRIQKTIVKGEHYTTAFLFGDACLFYALTWVKW